MTRVNPLLILLLSIVMFLVSIKLFLTSQTELKTSVVDFDTFISKAYEYKNLTNIWSNKSVKTKVNKIAKLSNIKHIKFKEKAKSIVITINNEKIYSIDRFINKILNNSFVIKKIDIKSSSAMLEIGK